MVTAVDQRGNGVGYRRKIADNDRDRFCINAKTSSVYFPPIEYFFFFFYSFFSVAFLFREGRGRYAVRLGYVDHEIYTSFEIDGFSP